MDAHKLWMLRDFIGTNKVLFRIPVYQRNYDWSEANCDRLLDDIYEIINSGDKHFLGTIVFMAAKSGGFTLQEYTIIDGQQELANRHYSFNSTKRKHVHLNTDGVGMRWPWKLSDTIYLEANLSAWSCIRFIDNLISEFGFDRSQFSFNIVSEESDEGIENEE